MTRVRHLMAAASCAVVALAGCSTGADDTAAPAASSQEEQAEREEPGAPVVQLGAPGEDNRTLSPEEAEALEGPAHTEADVAFVQGMLPHHRQALEMAAMVEERTASEQLPLLAERIAASQTDELAQLQSWLSRRGETADGGHGHHGHGEVMPGMLTEAELDALRAAQGRRFDRMFLAAMIRHHEGAVSMVGELLSGDGGQESEVFQIASHIESDQLVEIARMKQMLAGGLS